MSEYLGRIVDFFVTEDSLRLGIVTGGGRDRPALTDQNGRQHSVATRNIAVVHEERPAAGRISSQLEPVVSRIEEFRQQIDAELLWESIHDDARELAAAELAVLYFGESDCCRCSALLRAVLEDPLRFRRKGSRIQARPAGQVEAQLTGERRRAEREEQRRQVRGWVSAVLQEGTEEGVETLPDREGILRRLEGFLLQKQPDEEVLKWLEGLDPEGTPRMIAYDVLAAVGRLPAAADPFLSAAGIDPRFSREASELAASLAPFGPTADRVDWTRAWTFAIDDEDTREVDDAFSVQADGDGFVLAVHIADAAHFVQRDDALDQEAQRRLSTLYLPQTTVRMLPERLSCELSSLQEGTDRPALTLRLQLSAEGELRNWELSEGQVRVTRNLTYEQVDQLLADHAEGPETDLLRVVRRATQRLAEARAKDGAFTVNRPELKVTVRNGDIRLKLLDTDSPSRRLVSELMVLFNTRAAAFCRSRGVPFVYRLQSRLSEVPVLPAHYDPVLVNDALGRMERSRFSLQPGSHGGLGVDGYTQLTSPIRRYLDLVLQRQLVAVLRQQAPPYADQELMAVMELVQTQESELRATERKAVRYYCLSWLQQNRGDDPIEAVVLKPADRGGYLVETREFFIRGILDTAAELAPGTVVMSRITRIHPARNALILAPIPM
jgi:exoribonuclease II